MGLTLVSSSLIFGHLILSALKEKQPLGPADKDHRELQQQTPCEIACVPATGEKAMGQTVSHKALKDTA